MATLAALLEQVSDAPRPIAEVEVDELVADLRATLEAAAAPVAPPTGEPPLRVTKDRITNVLACEQLAIETASPRPLHESAVRGRVLDRLLHHHVHGPAQRPPGPALAVAEDAFGAEREGELLEWLVTDPDVRARLADDATGFAEQLDRLGPVDPSWWPRCEERLRVDLAGGRVPCAARLDVVVGGRPTPHPMVVLEAKSGAFGQDHRDGLFWYALLATLRHSAPPAAVVGWSGWDGASWLQPVTAALLRGAAERGAVAITRLGELAGGRPPTRTPCRACAWCPVNATCDVAHVPDA